MRRGCCHGVAPPSFELESLTPMLSSGTDAMAAGMPPYMEGDLVSTAKCYLCERAGFKSWGYLQEHIRLKHGIKLRTIKGTWLHTTATKETSATRSKRRSHQSKTSMGGGQSEAAKKHHEKQVREDKSEAAARPELADGHDLELLGDPFVRIRHAEVVQTAAAGYWKAMWVAHGPDNQPATPPAIMHIEEEDLKEARSV